MKKFYSVSFFIFSFLLAISVTNVANAQVTLYAKTEDIDYANDGSITARGHILQYVITAGTTTNVTDTWIYANIPAGTAYVTGSTLLNGVALPDINGKMPFAGSGGSINSPSSGPGILFANDSAQIIFRVQVTANQGNINFYATLKGISATTLFQNSNTVSTVLETDSHCNIVFESSPSVPSGSRPLYPYRYIKTLNTSNGVALITVFAGPNGPCYNAITGTALPTGSVVTDVEAMAYDGNSNRLYFINNATSPAQDLCFIDVNTSPVSAKKFIGFPLETNTNTGYNITRMTFAADGYGYALTANAQDLIRFSINPSTSLPVISRLGPLVNDANNGINDVLAETGGDIFSDGSGKLYLVPNSGKLYRINTATGLSTYLGAISSMPVAGASSVVTDQTGSICIGGNYQNVFKVDLSGMNATSLISSTTNVWKSSDYAGCSLPVLAPALKVSKTYTHLNRGAIISGDTIEYTIEVINTGNMGAAAVKLYDAIPANTSYLGYTTTINGVAVADIGGLMPFSVSGGQFINSPSEPAGIVKPGAANKVVIKFWIVTEPNKKICNQSTVTYADVDGNTMYVISDDPAQPGDQDSTCFYSDSSAGSGARIAVSNRMQPSSIASVKVQPNPFVKELNLQIQLTKAEVVQVRLIDFYGRTVFTTSEKLGTGVNSLHLQVPANLSTGMYVLECWAGNNRLLQKKLLKH